MNNIEIARMYDDVKFPTKRNGDGCYDLYARFDEQEVAIQPHCTKLIPTGIKSHFPECYRINIRERGSNSKSCMMLQSGQIDSNYTGEWFIAVHNGNDVPLEISKTITEFERTDDFVRWPYSKAIAQFAVEKIPNVTLTEVAPEAIEVLQTERGEGRLGSSGK